MKNFISGIPSSDIDQVWKACLPFIEAAADKGQAEMTTDDIYHFCKEARMQLWIIFDENHKIQAAATTEIIDYPAKKVCRLVTLGGTNFDDWMESIQVIEEWASERNCVSLETFCRKGFLRKLNNYGYKQTYVVLGKDLTTLH